MSLNAVKMLGISITTSSKKEILEEVRKYLEKPSAFSRQPSAKNKKPFVVVTPNPEQIVYAQKDKHFAEILNRADVALPDGIGIVLAGRFLQGSGVRGQGSEILQRIPGVEFMEDLVAMAAEQGFPVALIGGRGRVAVEALECLRRKHRRLTGWAMEPGEVEIRPIRPITQSDQLMEQSVEEVVRKIRKTGVRLVFVGLGAPKQEFFIERLSLSLRDSASWRGEAISNMRSPRFATHRLVHGFARDDKGIVLMSVGGSFDIISGRTPRAPRAIQVAHLEWLWRLVREPWRIKRQLTLFRFVWQVFKRSTLKDL